MPTTAPDPFDTAVLIGRFQPFHQGHAGLLRRALDAATRVVVVLGSARAARTPRNPFTASEREAMIRATLTESDNARAAFVGQRDVWDAERWAREVRGLVAAASPGATALVGFRKDATSSYLGLFPDWSWIDAGRQGALDATPLRERLYGPEPLEAVLADLAEALPAPVAAFLREWGRGPFRQELSEEWKVAADYARRWGRGPFVTVDALVRALGHVLLVRRGRRPGLGAWALPGGFLETDEPLEKGAVRELREETGLDLGATCSVREMVFSHPGRSQRARIVTHAFLFEPAWDALPEVRGADDAAEARWVPESDLPGLEDRLFEDHFHILSQLLPGLPG